MTKLSALVFAHNEEARLEACLARLAFADEIVVVLDRCTDGSAAIARSFANVVVAGAFPLEGPRRAAGFAACTGDWVLEVDAGERVTLAFAAEVRSRILEAAGPDGFAAPVAAMARLSRGGGLGVAAIPGLPGLVGAHAHGDFPAGRAYRG